MSFSRITFAVISKPVAVVATSLAVVSCSPTGNPHLDMCMKIAGNLLPGEVKFGEMTEVEGSREMKMTLPYSSDGVNSEAICFFARENNDTYRTSPTSMLIDGNKIGTKELMSASLTSSKAVVKDSAEETKQQVAEKTEEAKVLASDAKDKATEMAADAKVKASEMADEAKVKAAEMAADAKVKADEMAAKVKESEVVDRAKTMADETKDKAKSALLDGAKKIQEKLEN